MPEHLGSNQEMQAIIELFLREGIVVSSDLFDYISKAEKPMELAKDILIGLRKLKEKPTILNLPFLERNLTSKLSLGRKSVKIKHFQNMGNRLYTTFLENKETPIHRWYFYPEGFSGSFVRECINNFEIKRGETILDPFVGSGTTLVTAKQMGINSIGIDVSPLMCFICRVKTNWDLDLKKLKDAIDDFIKEVEPLLLSVDAKRTLTRFTETVALPEKEPKIAPPGYSEINRYFSQSTLKKLLFLKEKIWEIDDEDVKDFFALCFASILIEVSNMKRMPDLTFNSQRENVPVAHIFKEKIKQMYDDLLNLKKKTSIEFGDVRIILADSKHITPTEVPPESVDMILTSPPYVGHGDYVKNTKIELWFLDFIKRTSEMRKLRNEMIVAHHRVSKARLREEPIFNDAELRKICTEISRKRLWSKTVHLVVQKFFDDMFMCLKQMFKVLKSGRYCIIVIGDSQFGGVHVPSHTLLAKAAKVVGFEIQNISVARERRTGAERKRVGGVKLDFKLKEYILTLRKP